MTTFINRHERCVGIRLWKSSRRFIQLWFCPSGYEIQQHSHPDEEIELRYLFGKSIFYRLKGKNVESFRPRWYHFGRSFTIPAGVVHWFKVSTWPLVFINSATFPKGVTPRSAAIDYKPI